MWFIGFIVCLVANAESNTAFFGTVPEREVTFEITLADQRVMHGAIRLNGVFIHDLQSLPAGAWIEIVEDTPWTGGGVHKEFLNKIRVVRETRLKRRSRLEEGWESAGYVFIEMPEGGPTPIKATEVAYAERARTMEAKVVAELQGKDEGESALDTLPGQTTTPRKVQLFAWVRMWGLHALVVIVTLLLLGVTVKKTGVL